MFNELYESNHYRYNGYFIYRSRALFGKEREKEIFEREMQDVATRHLSELQKLWGEMGYDSKDLGDRMVCL